MRVQLLVLLGAGLSLGALAACGGDSERSRPDAEVAPPGNEEEDAGADSADEDAGEPSSECSHAPKTHLEIINACTDAEQVEREPDLPLLLPDAGLPPLP